MTIDQFVNLATVFGFVKNCSSKREHDIIAFCKYNKYNIPIALVYSSTDHSITLSVCDDYDCLFYDCDLNKLPISGDDIDELEEWITDEYSVEDSYVYIKEITAESLAIGEYKILNPLENKLKNDYNLSLYDFGKCINSYT